MTFTFPSGFTTNQWLAQLSSHTLKKMDRGNDRNPQGMQVFAGDGVLNDIEIVQGVLPFYEKALKKLGQCERDCNLAGIQRFSPEVTQYEGILQEQGFAIYPKVTQSPMNGSNSLLGYASPLLPPDNLRDQLADEFYNHGLYYLESFSPKQAQEFFNRALRLNPTHVDSLIGMGYAFTQLGKLDEALTSLDQAKKLAPDNGVIDYYLGVHQVELARRHYPQTPETYTPALALFEAAVKKEPYLVQVYLDQVDLLKKQSKPDEALGILEIALAHTQDPYWRRIIHRNRALIYLDQGDTTGYCAALKASGDIKFVEERHTLHITLATFSLNYGNVDQAIYNANIARSLEQIHAALVIKNKAVVEQQNAMAPRSTWKPLRDQPLNYSPAYIMLRDIYTAMGDTSTASYYQEHIPIN